MNRKGRKEREEEMKNDSKFHRTAPCQKVGQFCESKLGLASASHFFALFASLAVNNPGSQTGQPMNFANISKGVNPYHTLGFSGTFVGLNEIGCDTKNGQKADYFAKNADSIGKQKTMGQMGHLKAW